MLIVDASCLYEVLADTPQSEGIRARLAADADQAAPHLIDAEVLSVIRSHHGRGLLDDTAAAQAVSDLIDWPGLRYPHWPLLPRAWELRDAIRTYDALYVVLAEVLGGVLLTLDRRLQRAARGLCPVESPPRE